MLLLNKTLLRMARGLWGWICLITALKMVSLAAIAGFAGAISAFLGQMDSPELTVAQAAELVGYQDAFYFSKRFKNHFGVSPSRMEGGS